MLRGFEIFVLCHRDKTAPYEGAKAETSKIISGKFEKLFSIRSSQPFLTEPEMLPNQINLELYYHIGSNDKISNEEMNSRKN